MAFVTLDTDKMMVPVLIPRAEAEPAVSGVNSSWLIAGGVGLSLLLSWLLFGSKVQRALTGGGRKRTPKPKKVAKKRR